MESSGHKQGRWQHQKLEAAWRDPACGTGDGGPGGPHELSPPPHSPSSGTLDKLLFISDRPELLTPLPRPRLMNTRE